MSENTVAAISIAINPAHIGLRKKPNIKPANQNGFAYHAITPAKIPDHPTAKGVGAEHEVVWTAAVREFQRRDAAGDSEQNDVDQQADPHVRFRNVRAKTEWKDDQTGIAPGRDTVAMRSFDSLSEREILALAISLEEEDERVYAEYAEGLRANFPGSAAVFDGMREEESGHRRRLIELFEKKYGGHIPMIRRQDIRGFVHRKPVWLMQPLGLDTVRDQASAMEVESRRFYEKAAARTQDAGVRQLLDDLAQEERSHENRAEELEKQKLGPDVKRAEDEDESRALRAAGGSARIGGVDGWLRVHAGAGVRGGIRNT